MRRLLALTLGLALVVGWPSHAAASATDYTFVSFDNYRPASINSAGYVLLNRSRGGPMDSADLWHDGITQTIIGDDEVHGLNYRRVFEITDSGLISGTAQGGGGGPVPSTWTTSAPGAGSALPAAADPLDYADWANSRGDVTGLGAVPIGAHEFATQSYLFPQGGSPVPIGNGFGQLSSSSDSTGVCGLSDAGQIVAHITRTATGVNGFYLLPSADATPAMSTQLDFTPPCSDGLYPIVHPMSRNGTLVGGRIRRGPDGTKTTIGSSDFTATSVNDSGSAVGNISGGVAGALVAGGVQTPLASLLPGGWTAMLPYEINNNGDIIGSCTASDNSTHGCLLERNSALTISTVTIAPDPPRATDDPITVSITVRNDTSDTVTGVSAGLTSSTPGVVTVSQAPTPASVASLGPGAATTFTAKLHPVGGGDASLSVTASGTDGSSTLTATPRTRTFTVTQLAGTVTDTKGKPVAGATVRVTGTDIHGGAVATGAVTAADGVYRLSLAAGSYDFDVRAGPTPTGQADGGRWTTTACAGMGPALPGTCHLDVASDATTLPSFGYVLPDLQAENVEISQGIQSETWDDTSGAYSGVPLVRDVPAVARVYAGVVADGTPPDVPAVPAQLHGYTAAGTELAGSPLTATARTLHAGPSLPAARTQPSGAYIFTLPPGWTEAGPIKLTADVDPEVDGIRPIHECKDCDANDTFSLSPIAFATVAPLTIRPFAITYRYKPADPHDDWLPETAPDLSGQFDRARDVLPLPTGGLVVQPFPQATLDITSDVTHVVQSWRSRNHQPLRKPDLSDCIAISLCRTDIHTLELAAIHRSITLTHGARTFLYGFEAVPDGFTAPALGLSVAGTHPMPRPLTSAAHEFMHLLDFKHASPCGGGGASGETAADWPPDQQGYIQGVGLDRRPDSAGTGLYKIIAPGVGNDQWYDLMSYCASVNDSDSWISTINWTKFVHERSTAARRAVPATGPRLAVDASIENGKVKLLGAGEIDAAATASQASPYHLEALGKGGHVIADIGVVPEALDDSPAVLLSANLPVKGVTGVQVVKGGKVVATERKPTPAPRVRLAVPRRRGGRLALHWKAHGARGVALTSTIQVRTKTGWQTLIAGLTTTRYTAKVPKPTAVRIAVNDGFTTIDSNVRKR